MQETVQVRKLGGQVIGQGLVVFFGCCGQVQFNEAGSGPAAASISSYTASSLLPVRPSKMTVAPCRA